MNGQEITMSGDYFTQILHNIPGFVCWKDLDSLYLGCNMNFALAAGLNSPDEIIGKTDYELAWGKTEAEIYCKHDQIVFKGESLLNFEETQLQADGQRKVLLTNKIPLRDSENKIIGVLVTYVDITDTKEKEKLITENQKYQTTIIEEQEEFKTVVGQVLHDIQSPLSSLRTIIESTKEIPEQKRISLRTASINILDITHQLLNQYRPNKSRVAVPGNERQTIMAAIVLSEILSDRRFRYRGLPIEFVYNLNQLNAFLFIKAEPSDLKRAISNLINNAVNSLPQNGGRVELSLKSNEEWVFIRVLDNGKGISSDMLEKIKNNTLVVETKKDGRGVGLIQVRDMLERNYGKLDIYSSVSGENHGTTVELRFPRISSPNWACEEIKFDSDDIIIILDDDELIHEAWNARIEHILEKIPTIMVKHYYNGSEVIDFIAKLPQKDNVYLLSDYEFIGQELNGIEIIEQCQIKRSVLVTSHFVNSDIRKQAIRKRIKLLPKELTHAVSLKMEQKTTKNVNVHMVFVDDEKNFTKNLVGQHYSHLVIDTYSDPFDFLENVTKYSLDTKLILDNYYYMDNNEVYDIDGLTLAKTLHKMGYKRLFLLSGEAFSVPGYLTLILKSDHEKIKILDKL